MFVQEQYLQPRQQHLFHVHLEQLQNGLLVFLHHDLVRQLEVHLQP